jgi:hypothetical protein
VYFWHPVEDWDAVLLFEASCDVSHFRGTELSPM